MVEAPPDLQALLIAQATAKSFRFDTMPSGPILQAWAKTVGPSLPNTR
jgi:hypothetical protein